MFKEIIGLKRSVEKDKTIPLFRTLRWYFFFLCQFVMIQKTIGAAQIDGLILEHGGPLMYKVFVRHHAFTAYVGLIGGIVGFVLTLRKFHLKYQFVQLGWTICTTFLIVAMSLFHLSNIYNGMCWFLLSTTLVITNDVFAYIWGVMFGKTPLIALSPKKTVEGFVGGGISTVLWSTIAINILSRADFFLCPQPRNAIGYVPFNALYNLSCDEEVKGQFFKVMFTVPGLNQNVTMLQCHAMVLALFASVVAPFGGFFASGFKRAFKIKDFGDSIPGHGGITDRFDCQVLMGVFTALYISAFVYSESQVIGLKDILEAVPSLTLAEKKGLRDALAYELRGL